jgi:dUTP pyrophosphatase
VGVELKIPYKTDETRMEPVRASDGAAGWDLYTAEYVALKPYRAIIVPTGIKAALPHGTVLLILPRSGFSLKNQIIMPNSIGVIDEDYRGSIGITMMWTPPIDEYLSNRSMTFEIPKFTRIAQALLVPYFEQDWSKVDALPETQRGDGGFGHTGHGALDAGSANDTSPLAKRPQ